MQKKFRGEDQWMLPSVSKKLDELSESSSSKKKEKKLKKSKKSKKSSKKHKKEKKGSRKKKYSSSESDDSSEDEERISKRKHKHKHFSDADSSSSSSGSDEDTWVEKSNKNGLAESKAEKEPKKKFDTPLEHDDWLGGFSSISAFAKSKEPKERKKEERKGIDSYDPGKSVRELNPYWKDGGDGLPKAFAKPNYDSDDDHRPVRQSYQSKPNERERQSNWRKKSEPQTSKSSSTMGENRNQKEYSRSSSSSSSRSPSPAPEPSEQKQSMTSRDDFLTDQQMNELGAKLVKAEIMGNDELATQLKDKLDRARKFRSEHKTEVLAKSFERRASGSSQNKREKEKSVVLSTTNSKGQTRPVASFRDDSDLWGRAGRKTKKQKVETHMDGERVRYFADDDKYDIKRMVRFLHDINSHFGKKNFTFLLICSLRPRNSHRPPIKICNLRI